MHELPQGFPALQCTKQPMHAEPEGTLQAAWLSTHASPQGTPLKHIFLHDVAAKFVTTNSSGTSSL
jgi:hypothetical protein